MNTKPIPKLLEVEIIEGLQMLLTLRLPGTPPQDVIGATNNTWVRAIFSICPNWNPELDKGRVLFAFTKMCVSVETWPTPKQLIPLIPKRERNIQVLNAPAKTPEEIEADRKWRVSNQQKIKEILTKFFENKRMPE